MSTLRMILPCWPVKDADNVRCRASSRVLQPHRDLLTLSRTAKSCADIFTAGQLMLRMRNGDAE